MISYKNQLKNFTLMKLCEKEICNYIIMSTALLTNISSNDIFADNAIDIMIIRNKSYNSLTLLLSLYVSSFTTAAHIFHIIHLEHAQIITRLSS